MSPPVRKPQSFAARFGWPETAAARRPLIIGHRGASALAPENTLAAFELATRLGADMWELDAQLSRDGVCIVSHDDHLQRVFGVDRHISALDAAEVTALAGAAIPSFAQAAALARAVGAGLYVELKAAGTGRLVWRELEAHSQRYAVLGSFDVRQVRELRDAGCPWPLAVLVPVGRDPFAMAEAAGADIVHLCWERAGDRPQDLVDEALIAEARARGLDVVLWHEERPDIIAAMMAKPVLGICSDRPDLLCDARSRRASA